MKELTISQTCEQLSIKRALFYTYVRMGYLKIIHLPPSGVRKDGTLRVGPRRVSAADVEALRRRIHGGEFEPRQQPARDRSGDAEGSTPKGGSRKSASPKPRPRPRVGAVMHFE